MICLCRGTLRPCTPASEVSTRYQSMPPWLEQALLPFQREGVRFGLERHGRAILADEMGVGSKFLVARGWIQPLMRPASQPITSVPPMQRLCKRWRFQAAIAANGRC